MCKLGGVIRHEYCIYSPFILMHMRYNWDFVGITALMRSSIAFGESFVDNRTSRGILLILAFGFLDQCLHRSWSPLSHLHVDAKDERIRVLTKKLWDFSWRNIYNKITRPTSLMKQVWIDSSLCRIDSVEDSGQDFLSESIQLYAESIRVIAASKNFPMWIDLDICWIV